MNPYPFLPHFGTMTLHPLSLSSQSPVLRRWGNPATQDPRLQLWRIGTWTLSCCTHMASLWYPRDQWQQHHCFQRSDTCKCLEKNDQILHNYCTCLCHHVDPSFLDTHMRHMASTVTCIVVSIGHPSLLAGTRKSKRFNFNHRYFQPSHFHHLTMQWFCKSIAFFKNNSLSLSIRSCTLLSWTPYTLLSRIILSSCISNSVCRRCLSYTTFSDDSIPITSSRCRLQMRIVRVVLVLRHQLHSTTWICHLNLNLPPEPATWISAYFSFNT